MKTHKGYFVTELVAEVGSLPSLAAQVVSLTSDPDCNLTALTRLILSDNVLTMRFLALANAAVTAHGQEIKDLRGALVRLGITRVRNVALLMGVHDMAPASSPAAGLDLVQYWQHCLAVASCAQGLAWQRGNADPEDAWLVGIMHGLGVTSLSQHTGADFLSVVEHARQHRCSLASAELRILDFHHGELAARILNDWKLPALFAETIEFHTENFEAHEVSPEARPLIQTLRDAIALARAIGFGHSGDHDPVATMADLARTLRLADPALEALAAKVDRDVQGMARVIGLDMSGNLFAAALQASQLEIVRVGLEGLDDRRVKEDLEAEMSAARNIQQRILPAATPHLDGFTVAAANFPSRGVSGDTYDFLSLKDGSCGLLIADVCGKGLPAAMLASTLQASIRALALVCDDPGVLLAAANRALFASSDPERFATLFLAVLAPHGNSLRYASAGHNPPLLRHADGSQQWLQPAGTPLGMLPEMEYPVTEVDLMPGDLLVAYTDGITEAVNAHDEEWTEQGLAKLVAQTADETPETIVKRVIAAVHRHVDPAVRLGEFETSGLPSGPADNAILPDAGDDLTLIVLRKT